MQIYIIFEKKMKDQNFNISLFEKKKVISSFKCNLFFEAHLLVINKNYFVT